MCSYRVRDAYCQLVEFYAQGTWIILFPFALLPPNAYGYFNILKISVIYENSGTEHSLMLSLRGQSCLQLQFKA